MGAAVVLVVATTVPVDLAWLSQRARVGQADHIGVVDIGLSPRDVALSKNSLRSIL